MDSVCFELMSGERKKKDTDFIEIKLFELF